MRSSDARLPPAIVSAASVALVIMAIGSAPAVAKRADGEFVRAVCSSQVSDDYGETSTLKRVMFLSVDYGPSYRRGRPVHDHKALRLELGGEVDGPWRSIYGSDEIINGVPTAARNFSGSIWDYEPFEGSDGFFETTARQSVTVSGPTWVKVVFQLGRRKISLGPIEPKWYEDPHEWLERPGPSNNAAVGGMSNWQLRIPLRKQHFKRLRRHEAKGGRMRVRFTYSFPETTEVVTYPDPFEPLTITRTSTTKHSAAECSATSRPVTFTVD